METVMRPILGFVLCLMLLACGNKGPLYLPDNLQELPTLDAPSTSDDDDTEKRDREGAES